MGNERRKEKFPCTEPNRAEPKEKSSRNPKESKTCRSETRDKLSASSNFTLFFVFAFAFTFHCNCSTTMIGSSPMLAKVLLGLAIPMPHCFYCLLWTRPKVWKSVAKKSKVHPVELLALVAMCMKVVQLVSFLFYVMTLLGTDVFQETYARAHPLTLLFGAFLVAAGQSLNFGTYKALGKDGVYYGIKYGRKIPWVTGFPFNVCPHPQYIGSSLSVWGILWPIMRVFTGEFFDLVTVGCYWSACYAASAIIESH